MRIKLTPGQMVYLHGWMAPKKTLTWGDVLSHPHLTLQFLLSANLPLHQLHQLQPDAKAWAKNGRADLHDCPLMGQWGAHPIHDFRAEIGELVNLRWPAEALVRMGVTYEDLVGLGLTPATMALFTHLTLVGWAQLGFRKEHALRVHEPALVALFGLPKADVLRSLPP